jgi:hypothetical protein
MERFFNPAALRPTCFSAATLDFIRKQAELTDEVFSNPIALPMSPCLCPPAVLLRPHS